MSSGFNNSILKFWSFLIWWNVFKKCMTCICFKAILMKRNPIQYQKWFLLFEKNKFGSLYICNWHLSQKFYLFSKVDNSQLKGNLSHLSTLIGEKIAWNTFFFSSWRLYIAYLFNNTNTIKLQNDFWTENRWSIYLLKAIPKCIDNMAYVTGFSKI